LAHDTTAAHNGLLSALVRIYITLHVQIGSTQTSLLADLRYCMLAGTSFFNITNLLILPTQCHCDCGFLLCDVVIPVAARSKAWVCGRLLAGVVGSNPAGGGHGCLSLVGVVC
jgi:hypothetical protein